MTITPAANRSRLPDQVGRRVAEPAGFAGGLLFCLLGKNKSDIFLMLLTCTKGHGFRSSFREWAGNIPNFRREVIETANQWE
jgi:hypothetical protein